MLLWLSGPTGSGKSSLAASLGRAGAAIVKEEIPEDLFRAFANDPVSHCSALQESIMYSRRRLWDSVAKRHIVAFDRSIDEDFGVFCRLHHERGFINEGALAALRALAESLTTDIPSPDLILFLDPGLSVLQERLARQGQPGVTTHALPRQVELYQEWIETRRESVLRINNDACDIACIRRLFEVFRQC